MSTDGLSVGGKNDDEGTIWAGSGRESEGEGE